MPLAHYNNITPINTSGKEYEPLYGNLFEVNFEFPKSLKHAVTSIEMSIMMLSAVNINLDLTKELGVVKQYFKYSGRQYLTTNKDNSIISGLKIKFNINVSDTFSMTTWNLLKQWYDNGWNSQTGQLHYKRNNTGRIIAHIHDREGVVIRRVSFEAVQLTGITGMSFAWDNETILDCEGTFIADYWIDMYYDLK